MIFRKNLFLNKNILVTGASSGLGLHFAQQASDLGASVTGISRSIEPSSFAKSLNDKSNKSDSIKLDFSNPNLSFDDLEFKRYDGVFLSAGISELKIFSKINDKDINIAFDVNVLGQIKLIKFLLKNKYINKEASIVFMSSINGTSIGSKGHVIYASTKAAINGFSMALANELASKRIRVNTIAAGLVKTPMFEENLRLIGEVEMKKYELKYPLGFGNCEDVSMYALFLMSEASRWITGQSHIIDGGHTIA